MKVFAYLLTAVIAYFLGSISPALIYSKIVEKKDVRKYGSGNAGATNMLRSFGLKAGIFTFLMDMVKGALCALIGKWLCGNEWGQALGTLAGVFGHMMPVYYNFKGGKGVSTSMGAMLTAAPLHSLVVYILAILIIVFTRIVSLASLTGFVMETVMLVLLFPNLTGIPMKLTIIILTVCIFLSHRENIKRLLAGKENKISLKKKQ